MTLDPSAKTKLFPWRCPRCMEKSVRLTTICYTAKRTDARQVHVVEIPALRIPQCQKCGEQIFTISVDEQIQAAFGAQQKLGVPSK
jgi:hypothetical protein